MDMSCLGRSARLLDSYDSPIKSNEYRIAVAVGPQNDSNWDYHFMVQTSTGMWAEKHGPGGETIYHSEGNPDTISWDLGDHKGYYGDVIYIAITIGG